MLLVCNDCLAGNEIRYATAITKNNKHSGGCSYCYRLNSLSKCCNKCGVEKTAQNTRQIYSKFLGQYIFVCYCDKCRRYAVKQSYEIHKNKYASRRSVPAIRNKYNNTQKKYRKNRRITDNAYKIKCNLRDLVSSAFKNYSKNGKVKSSNEYGIDLNAICEHLGNKPEGNYHIDHIIPISIFDLDNPIHVKLAHTSENFRWLSGPENISKSNKIVPEVFGNPILISILKEIGKYPETLPQT